MIDLRKPEDATFVSKVFKMILDASEGLPDKPDDVMSGALPTRASK
jgi:hypothetical protein